MVRPFLAALLCLSVYRTVALVSRYVLYPKKMYCCSPKIYVGFMILFDMKGLSFNE